MEALSLQARWISFDAAGPVERQWHARMDWHEGVQDYFGVLFTLSSGWEAFAQLRRRVVLWAPTPCCDVVQGHDRFLFRPDKPPACVRCMKRLACEHRIEWIPPIMPSYCFPDQLADLLSDTLPVMEAWLVAGEVAARMDSVFKAKVLAPGRVPDRAFSRVLTQASGPLFPPDATAATTA